MSNIIPYAINYYRQIKKKYGKERESAGPRSEVLKPLRLQRWWPINAKLYVNRQEGFIGTGLKKDEFVCDCSDIDDIIVIRKDGTLSHNKGG
ncbi:MAG: hypothetical protein MZV63_52070 [Marinilabiliales bacterium]|nr:hypothetical protein [Marinilabiliales bacterium]